MALASSRPIRYAYAGFGITCVGAGTVGIVVPGWPTTVFFIMALWAFKRSSPRLEDWLLNHRIVGPPLRDWEQHRVIRPRAKRIAIVTIWVTISLSLLFVSNLWVQVLLLSVAGMVTWYLVTRRTHP